MGWFSLIAFLFGKKARDNNCLKKKKRKKRKEKKSQKQKIRKISWLNDPEE